MTVMTNAGTTLEISIGQPATYDAPGFVALTYTNVASVVSLGEHGGTTALITFSPLDTRRVAKYKGSINNGSMPAALGFDLSDAGQALLKDGALGSSIDVDHAIKITYQDGSIEYFQSKIMSYTRNPGTIDSIVAANTTFELVNDIVDVAAP